MRGRGTLSANGSISSNNVSINRGKKTIPGNRTIVLIFWTCLAICVASILCQKQYANHNSYDDTSTAITKPVRELASSTHASNKKTKEKTEKKSKSSSSSTTSTSSSTTTMKTKNAPCPEEYRKLVWIQGGPRNKLLEPIYRAFHSRGFSVTKSITRAHFLWKDQPKYTGKFYTNLQPWQRYNQLPRTDKWDDKDEMALHMSRYYKEKGKKSSSTIVPLHSFPESYVLHLSDGLEDFRQRLLEENGGLDVPWVLKKPRINLGKGITMIGPQSDELKGLVDRLKLEQQEKQQQNKPVKRLVIQKYICDEMTYERRKFDVRVFWTVASIDPLIVLYHTQQNYVRIGHAVYDESNFSNSTKAHLTTHTYGSEEKKATWDEFREFIERHVYDSNSKFRDRFGINSNDDITSTTYDASTAATIDAIRRDPFGHVQNQMKTAIAHLVDAYKDVSLNGRSIVTENAFTLYAADMIIDNNLDAFIIEGTDGPGKDEDYDFRIKMHDELLGSMVDIAEDVTNRQEEGRPLDVREMKENGVFGGYEVVYDDGWMFDYRYERLSQKGCGGGGNNSKSSASSSATIPSLRKKQPNNDGGVALAPFTTPNVVPATFKALEKKDEDSESTTNPKTFWMKKRTGRASEPITRSFRRNGWTPVDNPEEAQVVYHVVRGEAYDVQDLYKPRPWQFVSQFPSQYSFFERNHLKYLDSSTGSTYSEGKYKKYEDKDESSGVCRPILHGGRRIKFTVYWLVLSLDPLTVLYHDGYVYYTYSKEDENEFVTVQKEDQDGKTSTERVWRGSQTGFEHFINSTYADIVSSSSSKAAAAAAAIQLDPVSHVRNQMKQSLVHLAEGFKKYTMSKNASSSSSYSSFALYPAQFEFDQDLNVFLKDSFHSYQEGESYPEIVYLHDDLYGSAFKLLEHLNSTDFNYSSNEELLGRYEWLIHMRPRGDISDEKTTRDSRNSDNSIWKFNYDWNHKAKECL